MSREKGREARVTRRALLRGGAGLAALAALDPQAVRAEEPAPGAGYVCSCCGARFDTARGLAEHSGAYHLRKLPPIQTVDEPTYTEFLTDRVARFDQKNIVFSRAAWDEEYKAWYATFATGGGNTPADIAGRALGAGGIFVDDVAGSLLPSYTGYSGHLQGAGGLYNWDEPVGAARYPVSDPAAMATEVKRIARLFGADLAGICKIDPRWVYSHYYDRETQAYGPLEISYKYAIVMGLEMDYQAIQTSPGYEASAVAALVYSRMAEVAGSVARYIRGLGYPAVPSGNDTTQSIPLAVDAGLGELGRSGLLITPQFGPRVRICKVFTDLPLAVDKPIDFGLRRWCVKCGLCARNCPVGAIRKGDRTTDTMSISNRPGILRWPVFVDRCYIFWRENGCSCGNCLAACPWGWSNRSWV